MGMASHAHVSCDGQRRANHSHHGVVGVRDGHRRRHHCGCVRLGAGTACAQVLVESTEALEVLVLVVEDFHHLLACDHLLHIAVERAQGSLLLREEPLGAPAREAHVGDDDRVAGKRDEREPPVKHNEKHDGSHGLDCRLDHVGKAVVERLRDGVHVVGEVAHYVAVARAVEPRERQRLNVAEKVSANVKDHALRGADHGLGVANACGNARCVDGGSQRDKMDEARPVAGSHGVYHGFYHVRSGEVCPASHADQNRHGQKLPAGVA